MLQTFEGHAQGVSDAAWSSTGDYICTASDDRTIKVWDVHTVRARVAQSCTPTNEHGDTRADAMHALLLTDAEWAHDGMQGECLRTLNGHKNYVFCVNFSPQVYPPPLSTSAPGSLASAPAHARNCLPPRVRTN
jgi:COMPASS component SWD3